MILLLPPLPPSAPLEYYHLVRLTGFGEGAGGAAAGSTAALDAPLCMDRAAGISLLPLNPLPLLEKREIGTISESARMNVPD